MRIKIKVINRHFFAILLGIAIVCFVPPENSGAQTPKDSQTLKGITVSPAFQLINIKGDDSKHSVSFKVTNNRTTAQTIDFSTADFNTLGESGGLVFVGTNPTEIQKKYGLTQWLRLDRTRVTIAPNKTVDIKGHILNQDSLSPGGHYGALMLSLGEDNSSNKNEVSLKPIASSLLFVTKLGGDTRKLELKDVTANHSLFRLPSVVDLKFHNSGNTHLIPRGTVTVTGPNGNLIKKGIINENSNIILPESNRFYNVPLDNISSANTPGNYKLIVDFRFDGHEQYRRYQESMFLITPGFLVATATLLGILVGSSVYLVKNPKQRKRLNSKIKRVKKPKRNPS